MLMIGVLKSLGRMWPLAQRGLTQVRMYAKEVLQRPVDMIPAPLPSEPIIEEPTNGATNCEDANGDFAQIDISWMDDLLQQPIHGLQQTPTPLSYDSFLNL
jgi:hypothetical protein